MKPATTPSFPQLYVNGRYMLQKVTGVQRCASIFLDNITGKLPYTLVQPTTNTQGSYDKFTAHLWEQCALPLKLIRNGRPTLLTLTGAGPISYSNQIITFFDAAPFRYPELFSKSYRTYITLLLGLQLKKVRGVVCISEFAREELYTFFPTIACSVAVAYPIPKQNCITTTEPRRKIALAVGSLDPRKNLISVVRAFRRLEDPSIELWIIGAENKNFMGQPELLSEMEDKRIHFKGYLSDDELMLAYQQAAVLVSASIYEGLGFTPLEATLAGCPTLISDIPIHREMLGDDSDYFKPEDISGLSQKLSRVFNDPLGAPEKITAMQQRIENFRSLNYVSALETLGVC